MAVDVTNYDFEGVYYCVDQSFLKFGIEFTHIYFTIFYHFYSFIHSVMLTFIKIITFNDFTSTIV